MTSANRPDRNLALDLVRVTEAAALAAAGMVGKGDKIAADQAAVDAMRLVLDTVSMNGTVVIGEGEKDEAPMLYNGETIGNGDGPDIDIAVDPLEGTTLTAKGMPNALAVIALAPRGTMFDPGPCVYMEKLAAGADVADLLDLDRPIGETLGLMAERRACAIGDLTVIVLDRPRHQEGITRDPRRRCARAAHLRRRRQRRAGRRLRGPPDRPALGSRRHARGRHRRRGREVHRRRTRRAPVAP